MTPSQVLSNADHSRDAAGLVYVYPVLSRRSGGVSIGINLNPNNACNWRCIYCQVPGLVRGGAPEIDVERLRSELSGFVDQLLHGRFMQERVPTEARRITDVALSGNGEPTSCRVFDQVVKVVLDVLRTAGLTGKIPVVLITNGSLIDRPPVQRGLVVLAAAPGEVWFKLDRVTPHGLRTINGTRMAAGRLLRNLELCAAICPTWIQTCVFALDGEPPGGAERSAWLEAVGGLVARGVRLRGVLLYGLARTSCQPEAARLSAVPKQWMNDFQAEIERLGLEVRSFP